MAAASFERADAPLLRREIEQLCGSIASVRDAMSEWESHLRAALDSDTKTELDLAEHLLTSGSPDLRRHVAKAMAAFQHASMRVRAVTIRALVEQGNLTLTEIAKRVRISRPMAARLYKAGAPEVDAEVDAEVEVSDSAF
ncbi:MAG TPA: hypothetical protein VE991_00125 [Acidimicrobiales bacterium]|nr:hypothetical protein [Acidimicrobiales bacterium]